MTWDRELEGYGRVDTRSFLDFLMGENMNI
jgi:hypothetical protein